MIIGARESVGEFCLLCYREPGKEGRNLGVVLLDRETDQLWFRLPSDWAGFPADAVPILEGMTDLLVALVGERGGRQTLELLEDTLSNVLQITDRESVLVADFPATLEELFRSHVRFP